MPFLPKFGNKSLAGIATSLARTRIPAAEVALAFFTNIKRFADLVARLSVRHTGQSKDNVEEVDHCDESKNGGL
jgi:hypothetical protein